MFILKCLLDLSESTHALSGAHSMVYQWWSL